MREDFTEGVYMLWNPRIEEFQDFSDLDEAMAEQDACSASHPEDPTTVFRVVRQFNGDRKD